MLSIIIKLINNNNIILITCQKLVTYDRGAGLRRNSISSSGMGSGNDLYLISFLVFPFTLHCTTQRGLQDLSINYNFYMLISSSQREVYVVCEFCGVRGL